LKKITQKYKLNMPQPDSIRAILSGGGTGGHIFPAIAIANALKSQVSIADILFVGAKGRMEMEKVPAAGYPIKGLWISGFQRRLTIDNLSFPFKVLSSLINARRIIREFKPDVVIGTGGYASGPTLRAAASMGIPTLIQEQNSFPGITNKMLAKKANLICVAFEGMEKFFPAHKIRLTGNPIRQDLVNNGITQEEALKAFSLETGRITVLVVGGSLGARTINESIYAGLRTFIDNKVQLIWQTGKLYADKASTAVGRFPGKGIITLPFITRMDQAYAAADIVISRSGAIAISELCIVGKPCILVPSPNVTDDHQTKNTLALTRQNAAIMVRDAKARQKLVAEVIALANDELKQKELKENIRKMAKPDAAEVIAGEAIGLIKR
jgi:UDP-N-acetylglucosamine--N-acetylmuramyl-(pentapeptide) pyrophosphoryl-undecaprenol N-acetylglucosamine transferase